MGCEVIVRLIANGIDSGIMHTENASRGLVLHNPTCRIYLVPGKKARGSMLVVLIRLDWIGYDDQDDLQ